MGDGDKRIKRLRPAWASRTLFQKMKENKKRSSKMVQQVKALTPRLTIWQSKFNPRTLSVERKK